MGLGRVNDSGLLLFGVASMDERLFKAIANFETEVSEPAPPPPESFLLLRFDRERRSFYPARSYRVPSRATCLCRLQFYRSSDVGRSKRLTIRTVSDVQVAVPVVQRQHARGIHLSRVMPATQVPRKRNVEIEQRA